LLDGSVDEAANAAEFQAAISAWRGDANHVSTRMLKGIVAKYLFNY
jgi:hypothetical protein